MSLEPTLEERPPKFPCAEPRNSRNTQSRGHCFYSGSVSARGSPGTERRKLVLSSTSALNKERIAGSRGTVSGRARRATPAADAGAHSARNKTAAALEQTTKQNARAQLSEGDSASRHLHGIYPGDLLSALVSRLTGADTRKDWAANAVRAYSNAISLDASLAEAHLGRARVYRFLERYAEARPDLQRAEELGITDASGAVKHRERRLPAQRLAVVAAAVIVTGASALWLLHFSHAIRAPTQPEPVPPLASNAPLGHPPASNESRSAPIPRPRAIASTVAAGSAARTSVPPPQNGAVASTGRDGITPRPASQPIEVAGSGTPVNAEVSTTDCNGRSTPEADCASGRVKPFAIAAPATEPSKAAATEHQAPEQACVHCAEMISSLPGASALAREDVEMIRLACRSSEPNGAEAYRACAVSQIARLEDAIRMPDLSVIPALDRQLIQSACVSASHDGPAAYRRCIGSQLIGLAGAPELPDLSGFTTERKLIIELACRDSAAAGAAAYHTCVDRQVKQARRKVASPAARAGG